MRRRYPAGQCALIFCFDEVSCLGMRAVGPMANPMPTQAALPLGHARRCSTMDATVGLPSISAPLGYRCGFEVGKGRIAGLPLGRGPGRSSGRAVATHAAGQRVPGAGMARSIR
jgi:hypothetical protein